MRIYTRQGDQGKTTIPGVSRRVFKHHPLVEIYGTFDELVMTLDVVRTQKQLPKSIQQLLKAVQQDVFTAGTQLFARRSNITAKTVQTLERQIDQFEDDLPPLRHFIFSCKTARCAYCQLARCVCRRLERRMTAFHRKQAMNKHILAYINRLSDLLFVIARKLDR